MKKIYLIYFMNGFPINKLMRKMGGCLLRIIFSVISALLCLVLISLFNEMPFRLEEKIFNLIVAPNLYLPFGVGILGFLFAMFGVKGYIRLTLLGLNIVGLVGYLVIFIMATVGFQEP